MHAPSLSELFELFAQVLLIVRGLECFTNFLGEVIPVSERTSTNCFAEVPLERGSLESCSCLVNSGVCIINTLGTKDIFNLQEPTTGILVRFSSVHRNVDSDFWGRRGRSRGGRGGRLEGFHGVSEGFHKGVELRLVHFDRVSLGEEEEDKCVCGGYSLNPLLPSCKRLVKTKGLLKSVNFVNDCI